MRRVATSVSVVGDHDSEWVRSILEEVGGASDCSWNLLPYLFVTFMTSTIWNTTAFNVDTGGFSNNVLCLVRCICSVIAGSGFVRLEREYQQKQALSNGHVTETFDPVTENSCSAEASVKSTMQLFIKFSAGIILESWNESNRSNLVAKLIFLDQLCELSPYLPRSLLESHVPCAILRAVYSQYYLSSSTPLALSSSSPRYSPDMSLAHASPASKQPYGDSTPKSNVNDSGYFKASSTHGQDQYDTENGRRSGLLDYSLRYKTKFVEGSTSSSTGPSPLPRFAVSRSGPISVE